MIFEDEEKTALITNKDLYYCKVMLFGLKNVGAIYQHLVHKVFKSQISRNIEVYVDDVLLKSTEAYRHIVNLKEAFGELR